LAVHSQATGKNVSFDVSSWPVEFGVLSLYRFVDGRKALDEPK